MAAGRSAPSLRDAHIHSKRQAQTLQERLVLHCISVQDEASRSHLHSGLARALLLLCLGFQIYTRLFGNDFSMLSQLLVSSFAELLLLFLIIVPTLMAAYLGWTLFLPSGKRLQNWSVDSGLPHPLVSFYTMLHTINATMVAPLSLALYSRVLFWTTSSSGSFTSHVYQDLNGKLSTGTVALLGVMVAPCIFSLAAAVLYGSMGISLLRSQDFLSASNRIPFMLLPLNLYMTLICNTLTFNINGPVTSQGTGIFLNVLSLAISLLGILAAAHYTVFYNRQYKRIMLLGNWAVLVSTVFDMIYTASDRKGSLKIALVLFFVLVFGARLLKNVEYFLTVLDPESEYISLRLVLDLEQALHEYRAGHEALKPVMMQVRTYLKQDADPTKRGEVGQHKLATTEQDLESINQELFSFYLFSLFLKASQNSSKTEFMVGFHFAHFLSTQKTNFMLLSIMIRRLKDSDLSFSELFLLRRLETLITQSLKQKEVESSGSVHEDRKREGKGGSGPSGFKGSKSSLNLYKTVETIKLYEELMWNMRKQIDLVTSFYEQLEQPTTWIVKLHETVEQINRGRMVCADLFDRVDEAASSVQAFHILPYALFLEQTENNFDKGAELVKYYDSKTNMMYKHLGRSVRDVLLENSITLVVEAEKGKLGNIVFTSRNLRQAFGPEVPEIDGQSLDLFFNPEMAKVHQLELERFLTKLDREYLGYRQQRYVTFGNNIYYRVVAVTKFVPHIEDGFQLILLVKNLSSDLVNGNPNVMNSVTLAVDDSLNIVGVGYNKNLLRDDHTLNPSVEALIGQPLEVVSPEGKHLVDSYLQLMDSSDDPKTLALQRKRLLLAAVGERKYRKFYNKEDILTGATTSYSTRVEKTHTRIQTRKVEEDAKESEGNVEDEEIEMEMIDLEEEVQNLKASITGANFPPSGAPATLQLVQIQQDDSPNPENWKPEITIVPARARIELMRINSEGTFRDLHSGEQSEKKYLENFDQIKKKSNQQIVENDEPLPSTARDLHPKLIADGVFDALKIKLVASLAMVNFTLQEGSATEELSSLNKIVLQTDASNPAAGIGYFNGQNSSMLQTETLKQGDDARPEVILEQDADFDKETGHPAFLHKAQMDSAFKSSLHSLPSLKKANNLELSPKEPGKLNPIQEAFLGLHHSINRSGSTPKPSLVPLRSANISEINQDSNPGEIPTPLLKKGPSISEAIVRIPQSTLSPPKLESSLEKPTTLKAQNQVLKTKESKETFKRYLSKMYEQKYTEDRANKSPAVRGSPEGAVFPETVETRQPKKSILQLQIHLARQAESAKPELTTESVRVSVPPMKTSLLPVVKEFNHLFGKSSSNNNVDLVQDPAKQLDNNQKSNSRSVNRSKQAGLLAEGNPQGAKKAEAVVDQGSMRSSNRTSHTGSRSHLVIRRMMKNPKINRLPQLSIFFLICVTICLVHVFQEFLRVNFANSFDEVNSLQHVFATLVSMDCFFKASLINILENQITLAGQGIYPDRYKFLDPDLLDIQNASIGEFEYHITSAETQHNKLMLTIQELEPSNIDKFVTADLPLEVRVATTDYKSSNIGSTTNTRTSNLNPLQISLLIMYDLHVWWDNKQQYGNWASYNYFYYAIESWMQSVEQVFENFNGASLDTIDFLSNLSIYLLVGFSIFTQALLGLLYYQARTIRRGMITTMKNLEYLRMFEILTKQERLRYLKSILEDTNDLEAHRRKIVSILRGMRNQRISVNLESGVQGPNEKPASDYKPQNLTSKTFTSKTISQVIPKRQPAHAKPQIQQAKPQVMITGAQNTAGPTNPIAGDPGMNASLNTPSTDRRHVAAMYKMKKENKDTSYMLGNKIKILPSQWLGLGILLLALIVVAEIQVGLNILTSDRQRSSAVSYTNWMNVNRDYFLYVFYLNNLEAVIYIDSAGDMDLVELVPDLNDLAYKYFDLQSKYATKLINEIRSMDSDTRKFGYTKFFDSPCNFLDGSVYEVDVKDCVKFGGGVVNNGYLNFMDYTRLLVEQVKDNYVNEATIGRIVNTTAFLTFAYYNKVILRPMFEVVREEMIQSSDNVNGTSNAFVNLFGTTFQAILSACICIMFFFLMREIDYNTGLCYSIFLLLPEETYTINHYIRGFIKRLDG